MRMGSPDCNGVVSGPHPDATVPRGQPRALLTIIGVLVVGHEGHALLPDSLEVSPVAVTGPEEHREQQGLGHGAPQHTEHHPGSRGIGPQAAEAHHLRAQSTAWLAGLSCLSTGHVHGPLGRAGGHRGQRPRSLYAGMGPSLPSTAQPCYLPCCCPWDSLWGELGEDRPGGPGLRATLPADTQHLLGQEPQPWPLQRGQGLDPTGDSQDRGSNGVPYGADLSVTARDKGVGSTGPPRFLLRRETGVAPAPFLYQHWHKKCQAPLDIKGPCSWGSTMAQL